MLQIVKTILVTGGAGFIGSHLVERLIARGDRVICVDSFDPFYSPQVKRENIERILPHQRFELVECDVRDRDGLERAFRSHDIERVVHLAARAGVRPSIEQPALYQDINVGGTINLLELSRVYSVSGFILGSSSSVYGTSDVFPFSEAKSPCRPVSPYGASKLAAELYCHAYHHLYAMPLTCLRFFTVYGPRQRPDMAIHRFTALIERGEEIALYGDGSSKRDYTYVDDIVDGIAAAIDRPLDFEAINLGGAEAVELGQLVSLIEAGLGMKARVRRVEAQPGDVPATCADISRAKSLLDFAPSVRLEDGIARFIDWYRKRGH